MLNIIYQPPNCFQQNESILSVFDKGEGKGK